MGGSGTAWALPETTGRPTPTFKLSGSTILGDLATFGDLGYAQSKQGEKLDTIKTQTSGTLSKLREDNERLNRELRQRREDSGETESFPA